MPDAPGNAAYELAEGRRVYLAAPAGHGKTHAIAEAVRLAAPAHGRQLVLTHTHAGVHALEEKLTKLRVPRNRWRVATISGWAHKYAAAFRRVSGFPEEQPRGEGWDAVYPAAQACLRVPAIRDVLLATYGGVFVDEYQDCTTTQHELVMQVAELLPCRVLGDPLQGIFEFAGPTVDLDKDLGSFSRLDPLATPYRWINAGHQDLADWLRQAREDLAAGRPVTLASPVVHVPTGHTELADHCRSLLGSEGNTVVAHRFPGQAHHFAKGLGGRFRSMEEMDCSDLLDFAASLDAADPPGQAVALIDHALRMTSNTGSVLGSLRDGIEGGNFRPSRYRANRDLAESLQAVLEAGGPAALSRSLSEVRALGGATLFRQELFHETLRALKAMATGKYETFHAAAVEIRERTRHRGRVPDRFTSSRILLIKGLEYRNAVVAKADELGPKELYVALTRGSHTLAVQSASQTITPAVRATAVAAKPVAALPSQQSLQMLFD